MNSTAQVRAVDVVSEPAISKSNMDDLKFWTPSVPWNDDSGELSSIFTKNASMKSFG